MPIKGVHHGPIEELSRTNTATEEPITQESLNAWQTDPVGFSRDMLKAEPWEKQKEILEAVQVHNRVAVRSCNGSGKTFIAAHAVLWWLMCFPDSLVITTAPTEHQVRDMLWREIRRVYHGNEHLIGGKLLRTSLELDDKHYALGLSTNTPERFQGFHEGHILFVVDEASGVREGIFEAIEGSMTSDHARMLLLGNPTALSGYFYEAFHRRRSLWHTIHISALETPNVKVGKVTKPTLVTPKWVEDAKVNWGEDSPMYQIRVLGEFPSESEDTLISLKIIENAVENPAVDEDHAHDVQDGDPQDCDPQDDDPQDDDPQDGDPQDGDPQDDDPQDDDPQDGDPQDGDSQDDVPVEIGVDVARFGSDRTVICVRRGDRVIDIASFTKKNTMETAGLVNEFVKQYAPTCVRVDSIGVGAGVVDRLKELRVPGVSGINVARRATNPEHFANLKAELYDGLRERFQQGRIRIPGNGKLISELASIRYSFSSSGQIRLEDKDELRGRGQPSPDMADALMLAFAHSPRRGFRMWA